MAQALRLTVMAEGVETAGQEAYLRARGCGLAQGFRYSRPLPSGEFAALLERQAADFFSQR